MLSNIRRPNLRVHTPDDSPIPGPRRGAQGTWAWRGQCTLKPNVKIARQRSIRCYTYALPRQHIKRTHHQSCFMASSSQNSQSWGSHPINHALSRRQVPSCARLEPYHIPTGPLHSLPAPSAYAHPPRSLVYPKARCTASHIHSDHTCLQIILSHSCFKRLS